MSNQERLMKVLLGPHISEKAHQVADQCNQVVFKVAPDATKPEIKKAVELLLKVDVESVQVTNVNGKTKRSRFAMGKRKNWRKAYVRIKAGQDINFMGAE
ncbi:MAG: 50S ribosomal protein L23 [Gammaproteobacteria bacterium]|nr:50S ribosomal protein L23 [Gammaproteobacteria bacterium]MDH5651215.1 50S ribosomal protein L23 [Gammaproteobacteria bacterium]